jgi:MOSC domain-containing protein YiiM
MDGAAQVQPWAAASSSAVAPTWIGAITHLHFCAAASEPMHAADSLTLIADKGIEGDRYLLGRGTYSPKPEPGRQVTLFEIETLEAIARDHRIALAPHEHRRNVTVRGVPLNHLVGRRFRVGPVLLEATRLSVPCRYLEDLLDKPVFKPLLNRSGLNCRILEGGVVRLGDPVHPA